MGNVQGEIRIDRDFFPLGRDLDVLVHEKLPEFGRHMASGSSGGDSSERSMRQTYQQVGAKGKT
jgi:hypothetical protein